MKREIVRLQSLADLDAEALRIEKCAASGLVRPLGNWTAAQVFQHLGIFVKGSLDGFGFEYPWHVRALSQLIGRISWRWLMRLAFRAGFKNPAVARSVEPDPSVELHTAGEFLRCQIRRVHDEEKMNQPSPTGERLTHEQWIDCHLRHAELHLSFLKTEAIESGPY